MVAFAMTAMVACDKEENNGNNGNTDPTPNILDNTLIYDGVTYTGTSHVTVGAYNLMYVLEGSEGVGFTVNGNLSPDVSNCTIDLTRHNEGLNFGVHLNVGDILDMQFHNLPQNLSCFLNGDNLGSTSCFSSGTATVTVADGRLTVQLEGTLINGKVLKYKMVVATQAGSDPEPGHNELIVGTQRYVMQPTLSISNEGVYLFGADDDNGLFSIIADIPSSLLGQSVDLSQASSSSHYYINFSSTNLSFALQRGDEPISEINGEEVANVFSRGSMQLTNENGIVILSVSGTLSNGTFVGFKMNVATTDIEAMDGQVVFDGIVSPAIVSGSSSSEGNAYSLSVSGQGENAIGVSVDIRAANIGQTIDLSASTSPCYYAIGVHLWPLQVTAQQNASNSGSITACYWHIDTQTNEPVEGNIFTRGFLSTDEDEYAISMTINGILTNGHSFSAQMRIDKSEIEILNRKR